MTATDDRTQWLEALRQKHGAREALLFERPPWSRSVRVLSARATSSDEPPVLRIDGRPDERPDALVEVALIDPSRPPVAPIDTSTALRRLSEDATSPQPMLVSALLHDLKNSLGAQSLLLGTAERELRNASDGTRAVRFDPLLESIALCRESVAIAADRAQVSQWILSASAAASMSGDTWLRLALAGLSSDERERLTRSVSPESRTGPKGDVRSLVTTATALCALACAGERTEQRSQPSRGEVRCEGEALSLEVALPSKCVTLEALWDAISGAAPAAGSRSDAMIGLAEVLVSTERFELVASRASGTVVRVFAARSSGVLR
jgi:hypothetical protein